MKATTKIEYTLEGMTLRKFFNFIMRKFENYKIIPSFDWSDFKRWNGEIHDCFRDKETDCVFKLITEYSEDSSYFYYEDTKEY